MTATALRRLASQPEAPSPHTWTGIDLAAPGTTDGCAIGIHAGGRAGFYDKSTGRKWGDAEFADMAEEACTGRYPVIAASPKPLEIELAPDELAI